MIVKIKLTLYAIFHFLFLFTGCILALSEMLNVVILQYFAFIPLIPGVLIGTHLDHEDEYKAKMEKLKTNGNKEDNNK